MQIRQIVGGGIFADGGTLNCRIQLIDGTECWLGLDARVPTAPRDRRIFLGGEYPNLPGVKLLERGSLEEVDVIRSLQDYLDRTCGFLRREALMEAELSALGEEDAKDRMVVNLLQAILDR